MFSLNWLFPQACISRRFPLCCMERGVRDVVRKQKQMQLCLAGGAPQSLRRSGMFPGEHRSLEWRTLY